MANATANGVRFNPTAGGTTDWTYSSAAAGYNSPALGNMVNGRIYVFRAETPDLSQWELTAGAYNSATGVLARTVVLQNSAGTGTMAGQSGAGTKINFSVAPVVTVTVTREDWLSLAESIAYTAGEKQQGRVNLGATTVWISDTAPSSNVNDSDLWWESDSGTLYLRYNDGSSSQWVGISTNTNLAAVLYTSQSLTNAQQVQARANIGALKNYLLNTAMMVSQENGATAVTTNGSFAVDQFEIASAGTSGAYSAAQVASTTPGGSPNRLRVTVTTADAAVAAGDLVLLRQKIEGLRVADLLFGTASAKPITIKFGVKAPAGTYCVVVLNGAANRSYVAEYTISAGEANADVVKSVTILGDTSGTWAKDNTTGFDVRWGLMVGSSFQQAAGSWGAAGASGSANQFNFMGTNGNVFELFDVGLYEGSAAPSFQVPDYASELALCMRYFETSGFNSSTLANAFCYSTTIVLGSYPFKVQKRTVPTFAAAGVASDYGVYRAGANNAIDTLPTMDSANQSAAIVRHFHSTGPFTAGASVLLSAITSVALYKFNARM